MTHPWTGRTIVVDDVAYRIDTVDAHHLYLSTNTTLRILAVTSATYALASLGLRPDARSTAIADTLARLAGPSGQATLPAVDFAAALLAATDPDRKAPPTPTEIRSALAALRDARPLITSAGAAVVAIECRIGSRAALTIQTDPTT